MPEPQVMENEDTRAFCNRCRHKTRHDEVYCHEAGVHDEVSDCRTVVTWAICKCCGCGEVHTRETIRYVDFPQPEVRYYPPREMRRLPKWAEKLPDHGQILLREVYSAMHSGNLCLATMGARALVDLAFLASVDDCGNFRAKLDAMIKGGFLALHNRDVIEAALDTGNAASHRAYRPDARQFEMVMDIMEHLLQSVFCLRDLGSRLRQAIPPRGDRQVHGSESNGI